MYFSQSIITMAKLRRMRWTGHVACIGEMKNEYSILVGKQLGRRPLGRCRHRWKNNTKTDFSEIGWNGMECIDMLQNRGH
jgi:hypothetical protein